MDIQFQPIKGKVEGLHLDLNVLSEDEHVPEIERYIRTIKERVRGAQTTLPFPKLPGQMTVELVANCVFWLNVFPKIAGVSATLSPRTMIIGNDLNYNKHCTLQYGDYVHTHKKGMNSTAIPRTIGAIAMHPTGNTQGGFWFYSLKTGRLINRGRCTPMPMPDKAIDCVHTLARQDPAGITFVNHNDGNDENNNMPGLVIHEADDDSASDYDGSNDGSDSTSDDSADNSADSDNSDGNANDSVSSAGTSHNNDDADDHANITGVDGNNETDTEPMTKTEPTPAPKTEPMTDNNRKGHTLRAWKDRSFTHLKTDGYLNHIEGKSSHVLETYALVIHALVEYNRDESKFSKYVHETLLSQWGMKQGLKIFGERGVEAMTKELQQIQDREVIKPMKANELNDEQR
jgi:hypothetical protein